MTGQQKDGGRKAFFGFIKNKKQEKWLLLLLVGILLLVITFPTKQKTADESGGIISETETDYEVYERRLEGGWSEFLGSMEGIGRVKVMVTLEAGTSRSSRRIRLWRNGRYRRRTERRNRPYKGEKPVGPDGAHGKRRPPLCGQGADTEGIRDRYHGTGR